VSSVIVSSVHTIFQVDIWCGIGVFYEQINKQTYAYLWQMKSMYVLFVVRDKNVGCTTTSRNHVKALILITWYRAFLEELGCEVKEARCYCYYY